MFISLSIASKVSQQWTSYNGTSKGQPLKNFTTIWRNPLLATRSNDNLGMKIGYDFPSHVNDVITTLCIVVYGVKQKKNPRIHINSQTIFFKVVQLHTTHTRKSIRLYAYIMYSKPKIMSIWIFKINFFSISNT
jgi:hypothetical protein